jgi:hypothetical protein
MSKEIVLRNKLAFHLGLLFITDHTVNWFSNTEEIVTRTIILFYNGHLFDNHKFLFKKADVLV